MESCKNIKPSSSFEDIPDGSLENMTIPPVNEYVSAMEKTYGENIGTDITSKQIASYLKTGMHQGGEIVFWSEKSGIKYTLWDRIKKVIHSPALRDFKWLDITPTYIPIYGFNGKIKKKPDGKIKSGKEVRYYHKAELEEYEKNEIKVGDARFNIKDFIGCKKDFFYSKQTYWDRLNTLFWHIKSDFSHVPPHFKNYLDNQSRINWFRDNVWKYFFSYGEEQKQAEKGLIQRGYNVFEDHVYFDHDPSIKRG
jgi:hypothetical protein